MFGQFLYLLGTRECELRPCHLGGCGLGLGSPNLNPQPRCWSRTCAHPVWETLRIGDEHGCRCLLVPTEILHLLSWKGHSLSFLLMEGSWCPLARRKSLFYINPAFSFPQARLSKSTTIRNQAFLLGALRQAGWCLDFCF